MKTALKTASTAIRRWLALYRMRSIEINLCGAYDTLPLVRDPLTRERMQLAIREMSLALCKARADYVRCLAHTHQRNEWCPRRETCARTITNRHARFGGSLHVKERLCVINEFEQFVAIEDDEK